MLHALGFATLNELVKTLRKNINTTTHLQQNNSLFCFFVFCFALVCFAWLCFFCLFLFVSVYASLYQPKQEDTSPRLAAVHEMECAKLSPKAANSEGPGRFFFT